MKQFCTIGLLAAVVTLFAAPVDAQQIDSVSTSEATTGQTFTIDGSGFGTKRPKVELWDTVADKKAKGIKLKVTEFGDTNLTVEVKKAKVGVFDLVVRPKGKGIEPATSAEPFEIVPIQNLAPEQSAGDPKEEITVFADFMGKKKARVKIGGKKAKVTTWEPSGAPTEGGSGGYFVFKVPKKLANGTYDIEIFNKTYNVMLPDFFEVENSSVGTGGGGGGGAKFVCKIGGKSFKGAAQSLVYTSVPTGSDVVTSFAPVHTGNPPKVWQISFQYDASVGGAAQLSGDDLLAVTYGEGIFPNLDTYIAADDFVVNITGVSGSGQLMGSVGGTLDKVGGSGPATLAVTGSSFVIDMVQTP